MTNNYIHHTFKACGSLSQERQELEAHDAKFTKKLGRTMIEKEKDTCAAVFLQDHACVGHFHGLLRLQRGE